MAPSTRLEKISDLHSHVFCKPAKKIHDGPDVTFFLTSLAYRDIMTFVLQLNRSVVPRKTSDEAGHKSVQKWLLRSDESSYSTPIRNLRTLLKKLEDFIQDAPPDTGPRRFGNVSFRKWSTLVEQRISGLLDTYLPPDFGPAKVELEAYLLGSFGSPQRLDYGTGHELSFLAFLGCLWKLNYFEDREDGLEERDIVLGVFEPYLHLARSLIKTYTLEPAGSHGVWGLDDNSFLPYIFGSAQLSPAISEVEETPIEGSIGDALPPASVAQSNLVDKEKATKMYFSAIAFINEVKKGPFWEHSPMLYDISGIKDGWGKVNKGMIKMYNAEVLSKFPVVQHFPFGSLFRWEKDPEAKPIPTSMHTSSQPLRNPSDTHAPSTVRPSGMPGPGGGTAAPWAGRAPPPPPAGFVNGATQAPWATNRGGSTLSSAQNGINVSSRRPPPPTIPEAPKPAGSDRGR